jgi:DNA-binding winged helix-turn-helix (wHTH) protein/Tfp pilus assembly protein PilF
VKPATPSPQAIRFGVFEVDLQSGSLHKHGIHIRLPEQPLQILAMLLDHVGEIVTRETLLENLWPAHSFVDFEHGLNSAVNKLRQALGDSAEHPRYIETLPRRGYRFVAAALPSAAANAKLSIAILPFRLLTPNQGDDYLTVALADALISQLSASADLQVRPTSAVTRYAGKVADPLVAARELKVRVIVDGSIQKFGPNLRVHVQAWKVADGSTLFSAKQDAEMVDLFGLQDRIADELVRALGSKAPRETAWHAVPPTKNPMAYELFLRAGERLSRSNPSDMRMAIEMLENGTKLDPDFADAWARLAIAYVQILTELGPNAHWVRRTERVIGRIKALDPGHAEAQVASGRFLWSPAKRFRNRLALRAFQSALQLKPGHQQARVWQSLVFLHVGLLEEAMEGAVAVLATNPDDSLALNTLGQVAFSRGEYDEAEAYYSRTLSVDPGGTWGNLWAPTAPLYGGPLDAAAEKIRAGSQVFPGEPMLAGCEALLWAKRGEHRKAESAIQRALRGRPLIHTHHIWHILAAAYAVLGKPRQAISLLQRAKDMGLPNYPLFRNDPHFQCLRNHPPFPRLMADLKSELESYKREFGQHG